MNWYALVPVEARSALRRPVTMACASWFLLSGIVFTTMLGGGEPVFAAAMRGFVLGLQYAAVPALLIGTAVGGEDDDLGTKRDLLLADISPMNLLIAKFVVAVDLVVMLSVLALVGGGLAGLVTSLVHEPVGRPSVATSGLGSALAIVALILPFVVITSGCTSAILRSRLGGAVVWIGLFALHASSHALPDALAPIAQAVRFLPLGSIYALATGRAIPAIASSSMRWSVALAVSIAWLALLGIGAVCRWRSWDGSDSRSRPAGSPRPVRWQRHVLGTAGLLLVLVLVACLLPHALTGLGLGHDPVYQALANKRQQDYLERLVTMIEAGDYREAEQYVGPAGNAGLAAIKNEIEHSGGDWALMRGSVGEGEKTYPSLSVETRSVAADGTPEVMLGDDFAFDLTFKRGSWQVLGIRKAN
jgi:hypothetical protein